MLKPKAIKDQNKVLVFVPSSSVKEEYLQMGIRELNQFGFEVCQVDKILSKKGVVAKDAIQVYSDIQGGLSDHKIDILWAGRGGYGSNLLLPFLTKLKIKTPKILIGSSDVSYLLWHILDHHQMVVFYGPMVCSGLAKREYNKDFLLKMLSGNYVREKISGQTLVGGKVEGIITGGCLTNLVSLIGTDYFPRIENRILFLEDHNERPYKLDRMIWQLLMAKKFEKIRGLVLGEFSNSFLDNKESNEFYKRLFSYLQNLDIPIIYNLPIGHVKNTHLIPLGIKVEIDTSQFSGLMINDKGVLG